MILNDDETHLYGKAVARDDDASICVLAKNIVLDRNHEDLDNCDDDDDEYYDDDNDTDDNDDNDDTDDNGGVQALQLNSPGEGELKLLFKLHLILNYSESMSF